ncbi:CRISPR-associated protein, Cse3 family [Methanolobus vulcani]|jgi:CRISPR system Cascade subunit CasE|uniref:CRISPR-associated protein, Cse3 family n=1 Tax=Methanolobus vulcani TaxID=38026 RepID=A0A7Z7AXX8_9EURY|nr:type I-E CRISPR-associated protein Cas6/Cse3/CasE [Methanolobus vulcani]SDF31010.1 CRISPR-associated protein, Cse3 family [Methanolobus vulcani]
MYFSKWLLKSNKPVNPYRLHKIIWQLFPDQADAERSFLFRIENTRQNCEQHIFLQSLSQPQATSEELIMLREPKEVHFDLKAGNSYRFMLCANPTKKINDKSGKDKRNQGKVRVPLIHDEEIVAWIKRQLEGSAEVDSVELVHKNLLRFYKNKSGDRHVGKIQTVTFLGVLTVENPELLIAKIANGIGPAKSFGCGLLTLAKI